MKYLIIPICKFVWAVILCILATIYYVALSIVLIMWNFKFSARWFQFQTMPLFNISPYWDCKSYFKNEVKTVIFKTYYHYIFGIE